MAAFDQFDGFTHQRVGVVNLLAELIPADSAPKLAVPATISSTPAPATVTLHGSQTDTVRVNAHTFLLVTPAYTETVTLMRDTVFLLDATSGDTRAQQDSAWIATLFPGRHPIAVVVTDLAWPHIAGVRFWVARGATIYSSRMSEDFLRRVVNRHWTLQPDVLEGMRAHAKFHFRAIADSLRLAGGALTAYELRGTSTEGALMVWSGTDRFLWAGDYIQSSGASPYYYDVYFSAARRGHRAGEGRIRARCAHELERTGAARSAPYAKPESVDRVRRTFQSPLPCEAQP